MVVLSFRIQVMGLVLLKYTVASCNDNSIKMRCYRVSHNAFYWNSLAHSIDESI